MCSIRALGVVALIVGIILLGFGLNSTQSVPEKVMEGVVGRYSQTTMWYLITGVAMIVGGIFAIRNYGSSKE